MKNLQSIAYAIILLPTAFLVAVFLPFTLGILFLSDKLSKKTKLMPTFLSVVLSLDNEEVKASKEPTPKKLKVYS